MKNELKVYNLINGKKELVNTIDIVNVNLTLAQIFKSKEIYKTKTSIKPIPYIGWVKIKQTFDKERYNTTYKTIYEYTLNWESI